MNEPSATSVSRTTTLTLVVGSVTMTPARAKTFVLMLMGTGCSSGTVMNGPPLTAVTRTEVALLTATPPSPSFKLMVKVVISFRPTGTRLGVGMKSSWRMASERLAALVVSTKPPAPLVVKPDAARLLLVNEPLSATSSEMVQVTRCKPSSSASATDTVVKGNTVWSSLIVTGGEMPTMMGASLTGLTSTLVLVSGPRNAVPSSTEMLKLTSSAELPVMRLGVGWNSRPRIAVVIASLELVIT